MVDSSCFGYKNYWREILTQKPEIESGYNSSQNFQVANQKFWFFIFLTHFTMDEKVDYEDTDGLIANEVQPPNSMNDQPGATTIYNEKKYSTFRKNELVFNDVNVMIPVKIKGHKMVKQILSDCR